MSLGAKQVLDQLLMGCSWNTDSVSRNAQRPALLFRTLMVVIMMTSAHWANGMYCGMDE